jgi:hypothetical protein
LGAASAAGFTGVTVGMARIFVKPAQACERFG